MTGHLDLLGPALAGTIVSVVLWFWLSRRLTARGRTRWRAAPLCLPLLLVSIGYGLYWFGFFQSPAAAVQLHAVKLTVSHATESLAPYALAAWLAASLLLLWPIVTRRQPD
ncbi:MAG: hypothetical protein IOC90_05280 [Methylocystis sp.]|jgi:hypothetical protein|nr:hypothetical protein [Methylocystis sp.]MCA3583468.1 hypothetical protein [Methylocystis sp.]MCA3587430.1 hypothetical protein [Methylocystis sp.]MCA3592763.1 hypothetical protein [Methylocystis sp.]